MASSLRRVSRSCIVEKNVVMSSFVVVAGGGGGRTKGRRGNQFPDEDDADVDEDEDVWFWAVGDLVSSNSSNACIEVVEDSSVLLLLLL